MRIRIRSILVLVALAWISAVSSSENVTQNPENGGDDGGEKRKNREVIELKGGPLDVAWVVQLSDLHFSVHHPERALDFEAFVGPTLSMINPSLVLITGDLTDGKSKDLLAMNQDEKEWIEYKQIMEDVIKRSGLRKSIFYDLRGNHDNFGVPSVGGSLDFFSKYSLNGQLKRNSTVNSVTIQNRERMLLFVGFDSTMSSGLRGPTNLFGHPTDELFTELSNELSQWNSRSVKPVTKISFGHFPLSFSAASNTGRTLKDIFLKNSLSAYLCGHLHTRFGKNLKRHHESSQHNLHSRELFQLNAHQIYPKDSENCSKGANVEEFWEWEMGDWRKSRVIRILAVDRGQISFVDFDLKLGAKRTILLPTFPLDSRLTPRASFHEYNCKAAVPSLYGTVRALVFSTSPIVSVMARIFDSSSGNLIVVMETPMRKHSDASSRGDLYVVPWNFKAFEDPSPVRFFLRIEATDIRGRTTLSELRPFSVKGFHAKLRWSWKEFFVMGCQWAALYYPILWSFYLFVVLFLFIPKAILFVSKKQYTYKNFTANRGLINGLGWILMELCNVPLVWYWITSYLFYLVLCPWLLGQVLPESEGQGYMTYKGWVLRSNTKEKPEFLGFPDIMVIVFPHLFWVVFPAICVIGALAAEGGIYRDHLRAISGKKEDDYNSEHEGAEGRSSVLNTLYTRRIRKILLVVSLAICWMHFQNCRALMKAYEMNPFVHFPFYSMSIPLLLGYTIYRTS